MFVCDVANSHHGHDARIRVLIVRCNTVYIYANKIQGSKEGTGLPNLGEAVVIVFFIYVKYQVNQPLCPLNQTVPTRPCVQPRIVIITPGWIYGVGYMVKDHSDNERGFMSPPLHGLLFLINKGFLYAPSHRQNSTYHGFCENWLEREIVQWDHRTISGRCTTELGLAAS